MNSTVVDVLVNIRELTEKLAASAVLTDREGVFPSNNVKLLGEHKYLGLLVPAEHGGLAASATPLHR